MAKFSGYVVGVICVLASSQLAFAGNADPSGALLISDAMFQHLQATPERWVKLQKRCDKEIGLPANAVADYGPAKHYTSDGVSHDDTAKFLSTDAGVAYRAALCFKLSGDMRYAQHTQQIADAWGKTLRRVSSE